MPVPQCTRLKASDEPSIFSRPCSTRRTELHSLDGGLRCCPAAPGALCRCAASARCARCCARRERICRSAAVSASADRRGVGAASHAGRGAAALAVCGCDLDRGLLDLARQLGVGRGPVGRATPTKLRLGAALLRTSRWLGDLHHGPLVATGDRLRSTTAGPEPGALRCNGRCGRRARADRSARGVRSSTAWLAARPDRAGSDRNAARSRRQRAAGHQCRHAGAEHDDQQRVEYNERYQHHEHQQHAHRDSGCACQRDCQRQAVRGGGACKRSSGRGTATCRARHGTGAGQCEAGGCVCAGAPAPRRPPAPGGRACDHNAAAGPGSPDAGAPSGGAAIRERQASAACHAARNACKVECRATWKGNACDR